MVKFNSEMMKIPKEILLVVKALRDAGFEALLAGGCVRDMLLDREPNDFDIATNATPKKIMKLFRRTLAVGEQFGVIVVLIDDKQVEVATFRSDVDYTDGRHPTDIVFTDARNDAQRRDFTVNGMFYDPIEGTVIDYVKGQEDIGSSLIRAIGEPDDRFAEDHLRMLRAVRFASVLGYEIEARTFQAIVDNAGAISKVSSERILVELQKMMVHNNRSVGMSLALSTGLLAIIFSDLKDDALNYGVGVISALSNEADCSFPLAMAALLSRVSSKQAQKICRNITASNADRKDIAYLLDNLSGLLEKDNYTQAELKRFLANPLYTDLIKLAGGVFEYTGKGLDIIDKLNSQIVALGDVEITPTAYLDGNDLQKLGITPGPQIGRLLYDLYTLQLDNIITSPQQAVDYVNGLIDN